MEAIIAAVENGTLDEAILDLNAARILRGVVKSPQFRGYVPSNNPDLEAHAALSRRAATEGMILLENNGALPLTIDKRIAVFGNGQVETVKGGFGSGDVNARYTVSILEGLIAAGYDVYEELARATRSTLRASGSCLSIHLKAAAGAVPGASSKASL